VATLILKATEKCNSNCYYCDVVTKQHTGTSMTLEVLETCFKRINAFLQADPHEKVDILWHGGEPLLVGPEFYESAAEFQQEHCAGTKDRISHSVQTNLTCFHEGFLRPFARLGITSLGTSYDPDPNMRGPGVPRDSETYNSRFMEALALVEHRQLAWGVIYVVTKRSMARPLDLFFFLTNLTIGKGFNMNPVLIYDDRRQDVAISPKEYADFLGAVFPSWWRDRHRYPDVQPFKGLVNSIIHGNKSLACMDSGDCTYDHVNVAPDGSTSQCGRSADWGLLDYGNIADRPLADILRDEKRRQLDERVQLLPRGECDRCRFWDICHGGCPLDAYAKHKSFMHKSEWCDAKRGFLEQYFEPITGARFEGAVVS